MGIYTVIAMTCAVDATRHTVYIAIWLECLPVVCAMHGTLGGTAMKIYVRCTACLGDIGAL